MQSFYTQYGPLVKNWGDTTPATKNDVVVRINGTPVEVSEVNPYTGLITLAEDVPATLPGEIQVEVDYCWFSNPTMTLTGLNTNGLILNKWDSTNQNETAVALTPLESPPSATARFPYSVVIGPQITPLQPALIGHRYLGYERAYSALLNSPTTLLLNQSPNALMRADVTKTPEDISYAYAGNTSPQNWNVTGSVTGAVGASSYTLDTTANSTVFPYGQAGVLHRPVDLSLPSTATITARLDIVSYSLDGVYTGVCFGLHNNQYLFLVGFLVINQVLHVGVLTNPQSPYLQESWSLCGGFTVTITDSKTFTTGVDLPAGVRFQIIGGSQAGMYEIATCGANEGVYTITGSFPADYTLEGNDVATGYKEVLWDTKTYTYSLVTEPDTARAEVYIGANMESVSLSLQTPASPSSTSLLLPTSLKGAVFWGSASRAAVSVSRWNFVRYAITYDQPVFHFKGIVAALDMTMLPESVSGHPWFRTENGGSARIKPPLLLRQNSEYQNFGYARIESFLSNSTVLDLDATFRVDSGASRIEIQTELGKRVTLGNLLYKESGGRSLLSLPASLSLSCLRLPESEGWTGSGATVRENRVLLTSASYTNSFVTTVDLTGNRIFDVVCRIDSIGTALRFGGRFGVNGRDIMISFADAPKRVVLLSAGAAVATYAFNWGDGKDHSYRLLCDSEVSFFVDDTLYGTLASTSFTVLGSPLQTQMEAVGASVSVGSFYASVSPAPDAKRTLGVLVGNDPADIDSWELPRTDSTRASNSSLLAVVEEMDWREDIQVRIRLDPGWGVTVFRPDLDLPPYYTGDYSSTYTEPSAGWINVEYERLPRNLDGLFGRILFGGWKQVSQQRWTDLRYRIYVPGSENLVAPKHMILNQYNVLSSGDYGLDITLESVQVVSLDPYRIALGPTDIYADRVYSVVTNGELISIDSWTFDPVSQVITLNEPLASPHEVVQVQFVGGRPITETYLLSQPLLQSVVLLNDSTPPILSQGRDQAIETPGEIISDPQGSGDTIQGVPYLGFENESLFDKVSTYRISEGTPHLLDLFTDQEGLVDVGFDGFADRVALAGSRWSPFDVFMVSGRGYQGSLVGSATTYPSKGAEVTFSLVVTDPYTETFDLFAETSADYTLEDYSSELYSRLGPWGGVGALALRSLLHGASVENPFVMEGGRKLGGSVTITEGSLS